MPTTRFSDILLGLEEFFGLCRDIGLSAEAESGRFGVYRSQISRLDAEIERLRVGEADMQAYRRLAADLSRYLVALAESQEVVELLPFLRVCSQPELVTRMRLLLAGPELPSEEDHASNQARNIQFELWLAGIFWRVGVQVELAEPDIRCKIGETSILVACKRLFSVKRLNRRINEATEQLRRNLDALPDQTSWGFIAISLSRVLGALDQSEAIANRSEGLERLSARIDAFVTQRGKWQQTREAQGVIFHIDSMFTNSETNRVEHGRFLTVFGNGPICEAVAVRLQSAAVH